MIQKSYSKINLSLKITGKNDQGYHTLDMVELPIQLHDVLEISKRPAGSPSHITCDEMVLAKFKENTCKRALDAMREKYKFSEGIDIFIHKIIPFAAGLGGGSSNCASTLKAVNTMLKLNALEKDLKEIGLSIGADVPFFFGCRPSRVEGIGEIINPLPKIKKFYCVLLKPEKGCSTKEIYSVCDSFERNPIDNEKVIEGLVKGDEDLIAANMGNDLMDPAMSINEQIQPAIDLLKGFGFKIVSMSGSGSCCFAMSQKLGLCIKAYKKLFKMGYNVYISKLINI